MKLTYLDKHGLGTLMGLIKNGVTGMYTVRGQAIYADTAFLALTTTEKEAIATGANTVNSAGIWQLIDGVWTKITVFEEGYVYDIINNFITDTDFLEGTDKEVLAGTNIVAVNTGTSASPVLKWDMLSGVLNLSKYQTKALVAPLSVFDNTTPTTYMTSADLPTSEVTAAATITDLMVAVIGGASSETGDVYRAHVEVDSDDDTKNAITWIKLGNQNTVEGALEFLGNVAPNTPITDAEIEALWENA